MNQIKGAMLCAALGLALPSASAQQAEEFPTRPIRIIVPFNAGTGSDESSRLYGEVVSKLLGQPVVVENRPGGSGLLAIQAVKSAPADGYTILLASNSPMAVNPVLMKNLQYDPFKDFRPVHGLTMDAATFVVRVDSPYKTINDLVEAVRKSAVPPSIGNYSAGYQLIATWLGNAAGIPVTHVPYKGGAQITTDVMGSQIDLGVNGFGSVASLLRAGKLRALAITADKRDPMFPDVPTMIESGFPDFETYVWASLFVRTETPDAVVKKLADAFEQAIASKEGQAYQASRPGSPMRMHTTQMGDFHRLEYERFKRVAEAAGIQPQ